MSKSVVGSRVRKSSRPARDHSQELAWIAEHGGAYRGQWVMVRYDKLLGANRDIRALLKRVPEDEAVDSVVCYIETEEEQKTIVL